ncbi:MAG: hypothetical protein Q4D78_03960 [Neisseria zoodegmatis]|uniref:hypothetical protein n=1 Tax=Neisseria zoodegmatis TaxID=326523 RepID=UPI0026EA4439|nr:hypothetical protein [Neisseria zoodegmatis]MDO5069341.1 hypothetical protein [Neisseria zoodegmatis]
MYTVSLPDGIARIVLRDNFPCIYLNNQKPIKHIVIEDLTSNSLPLNIDLTSNQTTGINQQNCFIYNNLNGYPFAYNIPYSMDVKDDDSTNQKLHAVEFCVRKKNKHIYVAQIGKTRTGSYYCSDNEWQPQKYYGGFFGWLEKLKDSIFNKDIIEYK